MDDGCVGCLVVMVTGIPGAGKSSCLAHVEAQLSSSGAATVGVAALRLDDFLPAAAGSSFTPAAWREASTALFARCQALVAGHLRSSAPHLQVVFVEDNMHYRSMRERYWRLCWHINMEQTAAGTRRGVGLLELRFALPLEVCLDRNENRRGTAAFIPCHVIQTLHELFEPCLRPETTAELREDKGTTAPGALWTVERRNEKPWLLLAPNQQALPDFIAASTQTLTADFLKLLLSDGVQSALHAQVSFALVKANAPRDAAAEQRWQQTNAEACKSAAHRLDLALRAMVRHYLSSLDPHEAQRRQIPVQRLKKAAMRDFNCLEAGFRHADDNAADQALQDVLLVFEGKLRDL